MADNGGVFHIVAVKFAGQNRAKQVVDLIKSQQKAGDYKLKSWAVVEVDGKGKAHVKQQGHGGKGAALGTGGGVLLGLIGGPAGLLAWALGGALVGGLAGKYGTHQFDKKQLESLGSGMEPNSSAIIVVIEDTMVEEFTSELGEEGASIVTLTLGDQLSGEMASVTEVVLGEETGEE